MSDLSEGVSLTATTSSREEPLLTTVLFLGWVDCGEGRRLSWLEVDLHVGIISFIAEAFECLERYGKGISGFSMGYLTPSS